MAKVSANLFPYLHLVPAAAPASPAAGAERLYLDSGDGNKLKRKNSSGTVTTIEGAGGGGAVPTRVRTQGAATADYATSSTTFVDLDNTYFSTSIAAVVGDEIEVQFDCLLYENNAGKDVSLAVAVNGSIPTLFAFGHEVYRCDAGGVLYPSHMRYSFTVASGDLSSGSVPIKIQWRDHTGTGAGGAGIHSATTGTAANVPQLSVINWKQ